MLVSSNVFTVGGGGSSHFYKYCQAGTAGDIINGVRYDLLEMHHNKVFFALNRVFYLVHQERLVGEVNECSKNTVLVVNPHSHIQELFFEEAALIKPLYQKVELVLALSAGKVMKW